MVLQFFIGLMAVSLAGWLHFNLLRTAMARARTGEFSPAIKFQILLLVATVGQCLAAGIFAFAYAISQEIGLGGFDVPGEIDVMGIYAFSLVNLTTLGLGDVVPTGHLKFLAGLEAMTGFLLISCSASHIFQAMKIDKGNRS